MKTTTHSHIFLIRVVSISAALGCAFALAPQAMAASDAATTMSVDQDAPLRVTLMPTLSVFASRTDPGRTRTHMATTTPLAATLLPTVHVTAHPVEPYASAQPHARTTAWPQAARVATASVALQLLSCIDGDAQREWTSSTLHASMMPR
jgi:hypothetical protein